MPIQQFSAGQTLTAAQMNALQESDFNYTIKTETGSSYTLIESDLGKMIKFTNSGSITLTIPTDASADFNVGDTIDLLLDSTGTLSVQGASGVTVSAEGSITELNTRYSIASLIKLAANSWMLTGVVMNTITDGEVTESKIAANAVTTGKIADGTIVNADINASAAIDKTKISGTAITAADTGTVTSTMIADGTIVDADVNASAAIAKTKISGTAVAQNDLGTGVLTFLGTPSSANLASAITDETGSGALVFGTSPTITPAEGTTTTATTGAGYMGMPQTAPAAAMPYTLLASDAGKHIYVTTTGTVTIPANGTTAFPIGTTIVIASANGVTTTVSITTDTLRLANSASTGSRTIASNGMATLLKLTSTLWIISGNGVT